eukprot:249465-Rhodomonas_salina.1
MQLPRITHVRLILIWRPSFSQVVGSVAETSLPGFADGRVVNIAPLSNNIETDNLELTQSVNPECVCDGWVGGVCAQARGKSVEARVRGSAARALCGGRGTQERGPTIPAALVSLLLSLPSSFLPSTTCAALISARCVFTSRLMTLGGAGQHCAVPVRASRGQSGRACRRCVPALPHQRLRHAVLLAPRVRPARCPALTHEALRPGTTVSAKSVSTLAGWIVPLSSLGYALPH